MLGMAEDLLLTYVERTSRKCISSFIFFLLTCLQGLKFEVCHFPEDWSLQSYSYKLILV